MSQREAEVGDLVEVTKPDKGESDLVGYRGIIRALPSETFPYYAVEITSLAHSPKAWNCAGRVPSGHGFVMDRHEFEVVGMGFAVQSDLAGIAAEYMAITSLPPLRD